jgi:hypothetical protein
MVDWKPTRYERQDMIFPNETKPRAHNNVNTLTIFIGDHNKMNLLFPFRPRPRRRCM